MNAVSIVTKPPSYLESLKDFANESKPLLEKVARVALAVLLVIPALLADAATKIYHYTQPLNDVEEIAEPAPVQTEISLAEDVHILHPSFKDFYQPQDLQAIFLAMSFIRTPQFDDSGKKFATELAETLSLNSFLNNPSFHTELFQREKALQKN